MQIKRLEKEFTKKGVRYTQVLKNESFVIYKCEDTECNDIYYEVFKYKLVDPSPFDDGGWDKIESYPTDKVFGLSAWCCSNLDIVRRVLTNHFGLDDEEIERYLV